MTVSHRKHKQVSKPAEDTTAATAPAVPGVQWHCDGCGSDITLTVRIRCASECQNFDLCGSCFCSGAETARHKAWHDYRVIEQHSYPIFTADWGADEELLLIDGCQTYGLGNWADIADHIGNRTKEEVEQHYLDVYIYGKDGTPAGEARAAEWTLQAHQEGRPAKPAGPNMDYVPDFTPDEFRQRKRRRIEKLREAQAAYVPPKLTKPLVSQPTHHSEIAGFMPGRLEFEYEYEHEAENLIKDLEFGKVYKYGGELIPGDKDVAEAATAAIAASISGAAAADARTQRAAQPVSMRGAAPAKTDAAGDGDTSMDVDGAEQTQESQAFQPPGSQAAESTAAAAAPAAAGASAQPDAAAGGEATDDKTPDWDEDEADVELKLTVLQMYNERLDRRARKKDFIFERNLVDYKKNTTAERRKTKEEREILQRVKHFAQLQTPMDFEDFVNGLAHEEALRKLALQLQHYRAAGITSLADAAEYDRERAERAKKAAAMAENGIAAFPAAGVYGTFPTTASRAMATPANRQRYREQSTVSIPEEIPTPAPVVPTPAAPAKEKTSSGNGSGTSGRRNSVNSENKVGRKPPKPLDLSDAPSLNLLSEPEKQLCSVLRIKPEPYLVIKKTILVEHIRRKGNLSRRECRQLLQIDVNKVGKIWDLLHEQGYLEAAEKAGLGAKGVGALPPPGAAGIKLANGGGGGGGGGAGAGAPGTGSRANGPNSTAMPLRTNSANGNAGTPKTGGAGAVNVLANGSAARGGENNGGRMKRAGSNNAGSTPSLGAGYGGPGAGNNNNNNNSGSSASYLGSSPTKGTPIQHASPFRPTAAV
ncbi:Transcriptional adapter ada2 [Tilletia horrida]|uniref:Transcriptional adapter ada2 n=1 Tax=Tilletia horrida TaxID=155126 RepID=A0AAN6JIW8_9BASI|nr:Transcriptional adapter ada2 [Tilletia horrida]